MPKTKLERWGFSGCFCEFSSYLHILLLYSPVSHTFRLSLLLCTYVLTTTTTLHPFNSLFSRIAWVSQKGKPFWILLVQEIMGWQWHQLDHMQIICTSLQTDNHLTTQFLQAGCPSCRPTNNVEATRLCTI